MKTKIYIGGVWLVISMFSLACHHEKADTTNESAPLINQEKIKAEIQSIEDHFAMIYNTGNTDSLTYYADDAVSYFDGQKPIKGKEAILKFINNELVEFPKGAKLKNETIEIYVTADGANVAEIGTYKLVDSTNKTIKVGHYFSFFAKRNGKYVCTRDMANSYSTEE